jgi:hypothetical protein
VAVWSRWAAQHHKQEKISNHRVSLEAILIPIAPPVMATKKWTSHGTLVMTWCPPPYYLPENTYLIRHAIDGVIEYLEGLERGDYVNHRNRYGCIALMEAALWGHSDFLEELIKLGTKKDL